MKWGERWRQFQLLKASAFHQMWDGSNFCSFQTPKVIDLKPSRPPWSHERGSLPDWKSSLSKWIIDSRQSKDQNDGGTIREAESSAVIKLHICTMVDPFVLSNLRSNDLTSLASTWKYLYQNSNPSLFPFCSPIFWWNLMNHHKLGPDFAWAQQPPHLHQRQLLCRMVAGSQGTSRPYSAFLRWKNSNRISTSCL